MFIKVWSTNELKLIISPHKIFITTITQNLQKRKSLELVDSVIVVSSLKKLKRNLKPCYYLFVTTNLNNYFKILTKVC